MIIAHRLATVLRADEIAMLEGGRLVEYGDRVRLMNDGESRFSSLLRTGMEIWDDEMPTPGPAAGRDRERVAAALETDDA